MSRLTDKVAIITGAASGQGAAEVRLFVAEGARVVLTDVSAQGAALAAELGPKAHFIRHDVASGADWAEVVQETLGRFGRIDVLVNNAGVYRPAPLLETDDALWDLHYRVNQLGVFLGLRAVAEPMAAGGGGSIVNISSGAGLRGVPGMFAYATTKWAARGMSKLAASELAPRGIRINSVHPGIIDTPMLAANPPERLKMFEGMIPLGRMGAADEVAQLALFLASDAASYITGAEVTVDGGVG